MESPAGRVLSDVRRIRKRKSDEHLRFARVILSLLIIAIGLSAWAILPAEAAGTLYINPASTPLLPKKTNFGIQVKVANMDPFNAWDISVKTDPRVLSPQTISITGNVLSSTFALVVIEAVNCVNGGKGAHPGQPGNLGCTATDGPGIAHSAAFAIAAPPSTTSISGLLFTITYKVVGEEGSPIHIFNDVIANGSSAGVSHTTVDGTYGTPSLASVNSELPSFGTVD